MTLYDKYRGWPYKNTFFLVISLIFLGLLWETPLLNNIIARIGVYGYISAFLSGIFFVSIFTVAPASIILFDLAENLNPYLVSMFAGIGAVLGDLLIFRFLKDRVFEEIKPLFDKAPKPAFISTLFKTPFFIWLLPVVGAIIIASPLPDEVGISILGISKIKVWQFVLITFLLNAAGILAVILLSRAF